MSDEAPTLASLRRSRARQPHTPSLFDSPPEPPSPTPRPSPSPQAVVPPVPEVFTVAELVRRVRSLVERTHARVTVEGEVSNWRPAASGHCYFTLKDGDAQLSVVLFRRQAQLLRFRPTDGNAVRISGQLSVYESRGQLQLIAETMQPIGLGAMLAAVQALKDRLRREGIFANQRALPAFPHCIGIVTSLHGAALRDIVKVCRRRHAAVNLLIYPAAVQGPQSAREVAAGVRWFSTHPNKADVILIARGGGSWEDLHGFDDEDLCRAIHASSIPVLTGIGHATDSVLADSAADLCAPTPSAAAELVTAAQHGIAERVARVHARLLRSARYELLRSRQRLAGLAAESILARVRNTLERRGQRLDDLSFRLDAALHRALRGRVARLQELESGLRRRHPSHRVLQDDHRLTLLLQRLRNAEGQRNAAAQTRLDRASTRLEALSPLRILDRGYALIYTPDGRLLRHPKQAPPGTRITAQLSGGRLAADVAAPES